VGTAVRERRHLRREPELATGADAIRRKTSASERDSTRNEAHAGRRAMAQCTDRPSG